VLAAFNGLPDIDTLAAGQWLRIPVTNAAVNMATEDKSASAPTEPITETGLRCRCPRLPPDVLALLRVFRRLHRHVRIL
jgi:hypothetical protein